VVVHFASAAAPRYLAGGWLTEGQVLSMPMILAGILMLAWAYRARQPSGNFVTAQMKPAQ
jgi:phosphatidylglycerol:prolipoprotein diacylglycerol transferase